MCRTAAENAAAATAAATAAVTAVASGSGPSGVDAAAATGMVDEVAPPPPKKKQRQRPLTKTELRRVEIRTLLNAGTPLPQIAKQLDCDKRTIQGVIHKLKKESQEERDMSYPFTSRALIVKSSGGRPKKRTPGISMLQLIQGDQAACS